MREINNAVAVLCSRISSSRLPGKVLKKLGGKTILEHILDRLKKSGITTILAIPHDEEVIYKPIADKYTGFVILYCGEPDSPLHRTANAVLSKARDAKWVIRVTHDDPLIDSDTMLALIDKCEAEDAGYGISPEIVEGAGVEIIRQDNLIYAANNRREPTEFISYFVKGQGLPYPKIVKLRPREAIRKPYRLTVDYSEDHIVLNAIFRVLGPETTLDAICRYLDKRPEIMNLNRLPILSIYTCAYNASSWIKQAINSVLSLRGPIEYILLDDCSTDDTLAKICAFAKDTRVTVGASEKNMGLASSCNHALAHCRGKYIMRLDADDVLSPIFEEELMVLIKAMKDGAHVIYPAYEEISENGDSIAAYIDPRINHHVGGAIFDRSFLNELRFREGIRHWEGKELLNRMDKAGAKIVYHPVPTWKYRQTKNSLSRSPANLTIREALREDI